MTNCTQLPAAAQRMMSASYAACSASLTAWLMKPPKLMLITWQPDSMQCQTPSTIADCVSRSICTTPSSTRTATTLAPGTNPVTPSVTTPRSFTNVVPCALVRIEPVAVPCDEPPGMLSTPLPASMNDADAATS